MQSGPLNVGPALFFCLAPALALGHRPEKQVAGIPPRLFFSLANKGMDQVWETFYAASFWRGLFTVLQDEPVCFTWWNLCRLPGTL